MADALTAQPRSAEAPAESATRVVLRAAGLVRTLAELLVEARWGLDSPLAFAERAQRTARRVLEGHGVTVKTRGPRPVGAAVIVANHLGYLDPLVVSTVVPCLSIAKGETRAWPLIGPALSGLGVLFVQRGAAHSGAIVLRRALRALRAGTVILNFPEGTTSHGRSVGPFRRGVFGLARRAGVPVIGARVSYDDDRVPWVGGESFAPHYGRLARAVSLTATVHFADPIILDPRDDPADAAQRLREVVSSLPAA